mgnify:FL=1
MNSLVSIITPVYNTKPFLQKTAASVIGQTYANWEWVLVDDLSTDGSIELLQSLSKKDKRIKPHFLTKNQGSGPARNVATKLAQGKYIAFLDSDDIWIKEKLQIQVAFMQKNQYAFSHTSYGFIDAMDAVIKNTYHVSKNPVTYEMLLKRTEISCLTAMYNQEIIGKMYMPDLRRKQDYALWLSILKKGFKSYQLDIETAYYRQHGASATSNKLKLIGKHWVFLYSYEKLNFVKSTYYTLSWGLSGFKKYYM